MRTIGFYVSPGFQMLDLAGPAGAFEAANDQLENQSRLPGPYPRG
jgi:transcriptional regulator GlxA family with amidase domain